MSESDSDLNFESADEDADFASGAKSKVNRKPTSNDEPPESSSIEGSASFAVINKISDSNLEASTNIDVRINMSFDQHFTSDQKEIINDSAKFQFNDKSHDSKVSETDSNSSVTESSNNPDPRVDALKESELKSEKKTDSSEPSYHQKVSTTIMKCESELQSDTSLLKPDKQQTEESKTHRERVILRLEKKKQLSKESPIESEKPSDFVNILQDPNEKKSSSWGFSSWSSSLLSSAASSVSTFSTQVSQGIGSVLETVESTLGAPPPEELAQTLNEKKAEKKELTSVEEEKENEGSGLLLGMSSWTKVLENTGSKVIMGGLDTLELIGKKTMDILTEGDPGLRKKRAVFSGGTNLSELLREIKARADEQSKENSEDDTDNIHYSQIFDEKQGLVHLEALEMLSKQSQAKFQRLLLRHSKHSEVKKRLEEIKSICENIPFLDDPSDCENFEDFEAVFKKYTLELSFPLNVENIINTQRKISETISSYESPSEDMQSPPKEIFQSAICSLADFTAKSIETFHKAAELILVQPNLDPDLEHCATNLTGLTTVMCIEVNNLASRYHKCLESTAEFLQKKGFSENVDVKTLATNVYVEASNSNNYIQDAYQMLVPVLQVRFLEAID
ncbi:protein FAM114A2-like [Argiope bruennichi]|uniref:protein FAM114A2-like n=1 Tax=Argiope bruennichi TaxID=94029 RepID=UPI002494F4BA|nr:protein FAM114A2-like [Argiope bruennichi]